MSSIGLNLGQWHPFAIYWDVYRNKAMFIAMFIVMFIAEFITLFIAMFIAMFIVMFIAMFIAMFIPNKQSVKFGKLCKTCDLDVYYDV